MIDQITIITSPTKSGYLMFTVGLIDILGSELVYHCSKDIECLDTSKETFLLHVSLITEDRKDDINNLMGSHVLDLGDFKLDYRLSEFEEPIRSAIYEHLNEATMDLGFRITGELPNLLLAEFLNIVDDTNTH